VRGNVTWILLAVIGLLAALALADALRSHKAAPRATPPTTPQPAKLQDVLQREEITGFVLYSDQDCRLHSLLLPRMVDDVVRDDGGADVFRCRFTTSGGRVLAGAEVASPDRTLLARCRRGTVIVRDWNTGAIDRRFDGCPFAWRPDGELTRLRNGEIVGGDRVLHSRTDLRSAVRANSGVATTLAGRRYEVRVTDFAWLDDRRLVAALDIEPTHGPPVFLAALFDGPALVAINTSPLGPYDDWIVSRTGLYAAAGNGAIIARNGQATDPPPGLPGGHAVAFSPDERWLAYVNGTSIFIVATPLSDELGRVVRLPIPARDLVWRPVSPATSVGPPIRR
jgi:hypothetical protein